MSKIYVKKPLNKANHSMGYKIVLVSKALLEDQLHRPSEGKGKKHPEWDGIEEATDAEIKQFAPEIWKKIHAEQVPAKAEGKGGIYIDPNIPTATYKVEEIKAWLTEQGAEFPEGALKKDLLKLVEELTALPE